MNWAPAIRPVVWRSDFVRYPGQPDRRGGRLSPAPAGKQLAAWVRDQRRSSVAAILPAMSPAARRNLVDGLRGLAAAAIQPADGPQAAP